MRTRRLLPGISLSAVVLAILGCAPTQLPLALRHTEPAVSRYALCPGGALVVKNTTGDIEVSSWDESGMRLLVTKVGRGAPEGHELELLDAVQVAVEERSDTVVVQTRAISSLPWRGASVAVNYQVMVPRQANLVLATGVGDIEVQDVVGDVTVNTGVGDIQVERLAGHLEARTSVGDVEVDVRMHAREDCLKVRAGVGDLHVRLPRGIAGHLRVQAGVGDIHTDFPVQIKGLLKSQGAGGKYEGELGSGGATIDLATDVGDVRLEAQ